MQLMQKIHKKIMKIINNEPSDNSIEIILNSEIDPDSWEELIDMKAINK